MANRVFVSPGVYTSELDLTFVAKQVGVTTLGIVGETPKGPAFEPVFISGYDEFQTIFGGLDPTLFRGTGYPKFEANYIAKGYLTQSSQLFVTRILGLSADVLIFSVSCLSISSTATSLVILSLRCCVCK
jgi:hypothetical protein